MAVDDVEFGKRRKRSSFYDKIGTSVSPYSVSRPVKLAPTVKIEEERLFAYILDATVSANSYATVMTILRQRLKPQHRFRNKERIDEMKRSLINMTKLLVKPTSRFPNFEHIEQRVESLVDQTYIVLPVIDHLHSEIKSYRDEYETYKETSDDFKLRYSLWTMDQADDLILHWLFGQPFIDRVGKDFWSRYGFKFAAESVKILSQIYVSYFAFPIWVNADVDDAVLYGFLGFMIAHEIFHTTSYDKSKGWLSFDDVDSYFYQCVMTIVSNACKLFEEGPCFSGQQTIYANTVEEDAGDAFGVRVALAAFYHKVADSARLNETVYSRLQITREQLFFYSVAIWTCKSFESTQHASSGDETSQSVYDVHSAMYVRINAILGNLPEFQKAFSCKPGDKMYMMPRCNIM